LYWLRDVGFVIGDGFGGHGPEHGEDSESAHSPLPRQRRERALQGVAGILTGACQCDG
jgi:hypothetical protein